ncbi:hypothetical protein J1614_007390 [Plenodomus biglobosus]|nr:hypothetical protein J1614_007390 [Plenodomus biglobosus]
MPQTSRQTLMCFIPYVYPGEEDKGKSPHLLGSYQMGRAINVRPSPKMDTLLDANNPKTNYVLIVTLYELLQSRRDPTSMEQWLFREGATAESDRVHQSIPRLPSGSL